MYKIYKKIYRGSLLLFTLLLISPVCAQSVNTIFQSVQIIPQRGMNNPAFTAPYDVYIGLPVLSGVHMQLNNDFFAYNRIVSRDANDSLRLGTDKFLSKLNLKNIVGLETTVELLNIGFKVKENYFTLGANFNLRTDMLLTKNTLNFLLKGPGANIGTNDLSGNSFDLKGYLSMYAGYTRQINKDISVGIRLKYLNGLYDFTTQRMNVRWDVNNGDMEQNPDETPYYYTLNVDGEISTNLPIDSNLKIGSFNPMDNLFQNNGFAVDLGVNYTIAENFNVNFSILDLGLIKWKNGVSNWTSVNSDIDYTFSGLSNLNIAQDGINIDSLARGLIREFIDTLGFEYSSNKAYKTRLSPTFVLGVGYTLLEKHQFNAIFKGIAKPYKFDFECGVSYSYTPVKNFSITINNIFNRGSWLNLGLALVGNLGPIQLYAAVDRINSFSVVAMKTVGVQAGINIVIGKHEIYESDRQRKRQEAAAEKNMRY